MFIYRYDIDNCKEKKIKNFQKFKIYLIRKQEKGKQKFTQVLLSRQQRNSTDPLKQ